MLFFNVPCGDKKGALDFDMAPVNISMILVTLVKSFPHSDLWALNVYKFH